MPVRRSSYGRHSPDVGERGSRTRSQIVAVTLELLGERGYHATLVDDIAGAAGISRATLYQYFESKDEIVVELLEECGGALQRVARRLGPLAPTPAGFDNLHWWLGEWAWVYDKYAALFLQWAGIDSPTAPLRRHIARFEEIYIGRLVERFEEAGVAGVDHGAIAVGLFAVVERCNFYRRTTTTGVSDDDLLHALAVVFQLVLFPDTSVAVLHHAPNGSEGARAGRGRAASTRAGANQAAGPARAGVRQAGRTREPRPPTPSDPTSLRVAGLSAQARTTVVALLDAGGRVFAANGFHRSNVHQVVTEAGVARGTFYKYFRDKLDLLTVLADECAAQMSEMSSRFADLGAPDATGYAASLRSWLADFVVLHRRHAGVFRAWLEPEPRAELAGSGAGVVRTAATTFATVFGAIERTYPLDTGAAAMIMIALLERVPDEASGTRYELTDEAAVETMALFVERSLLNGRLKSRRRPVARRGDTLVR